MELSSVEGLSKPASFVDEDTPKLFIVIRQIQATYVTFCGHGMFLSSSFSFVEATFAIKDTGGLSRCQPPLGVNLLSIAYGKVVTPLPPSPPDSAPVSQSKPQGAKTPSSALRVP